MDQTADSIKQSFKARLEQDEQVISALIINTLAPYTAVTDQFDVLLLVVSEKAESIHSIFHYIKDSARIQERWVDPKGLEKWLLNGKNRNIIQWILRGEIILDQNAYLEELRRNMLEFPPSLRDQKLLIQFSLFLRRFLQSRENLKEKNYLDAYSNVLLALHHWARIVIIEAGQHPEVMVWEQVRKVNPGVYKLYEELTLSKETMAQRLELVLLACEFSVMTKMGECSIAIQHVLKSREEPWSALELMKHPLLNTISSELPLLLNKLVQKSIIIEVAVALDEDLSLLEIRYTA